MQNEMLLIQLITLFGVMFVFLLLRFPVYYSIGAAAIVFAIVYPGTVPTEVIGQGFIQGVNKNTFVAIIFYFLLGEIMNSGGITDRLLRFAQAAMGHVTGALSHINIIASVIFAGVSGSAAADTACIGSMMIPMMIKQGYPPAYAAAITQCSAIIGPIIPPSAAIVLIATFMNVSVRKLLVAGIIPGLMIGVFELVASYIICKKRNYPKDEWRGWRLVWKEFKSAGWALLLPFVVCYCLVAGVGTIIEVGAVACLYGYFISIFVYREMKLKDFIKTLTGAAVQIARILSIIAAAGAFTWIIASCGFGAWFAKKAVEVGTTSTEVAFFCMLVIFIAGMILDVNVIQMAIIPIMLPTIFATGVDNVMFGVVAIITCMLGLNTPPVGQLIYMTASIANCNSALVVKESIPYIFVVILVIIILTLCPTLVSWLPNLVF